MKSLNQNIIIASRELFTNDGQAVLLYIERPISSDRMDEFSCRMVLTGGGVDGSDRIYGIDSMQALLLSVQHLKAFVERVSRVISPRSLLWELGDEQNSFGLNVAG